MTIDIDKTKTVSSDDDSIDIKEQLLQDTLSTIISIHENSTDIHDLSWLNDHLHIMAEHLERMRVGTTSAKNFIDMEQIEKEMLDLNNRFDNSYRKKLISQFKTSKQRMSFSSNKK
ncbi:MAG: hypothetical protein LBQ79_14910 [Deltaproteobacteria bacterium]|jgi:hypothetical protein|nr:hypothetical protein [Deltaproteobacteria bacterium]